MFKHNDRNTEFVVWSQLVRVSYLDILKKICRSAGPLSGDLLHTSGSFKKHLSFIEEKRWISLGVFNEILSLGQCLPGPTTTQMSFGIAP